jgi:hypothetical protein
MIRFFHWGQTDVQPALSAEILGATLPVLQTQRWKTQPETNRLSLYSVFPE